MGASEARRVTYREAFPIVYTSDLPLALAFYRDALGMTETFRFPSKGVPTFVSLTLADNSGLALADKGSTPPHHGLPMQLGAGAFELCVYTDDVDDAVAQLRTAGHAVLYEPANQPWGERMAYVADPDGNPVMICARI
jgi:lactoylglutathione lyase